MKRKQSPYKPGSVPLARCLSFIYSAGYPYGSSILPSIVSLKIRTDSPQPMVYANLQPPDGTALRSPAGWWSLTHTFSPLPKCMGGLFLLPYPAVTNSWHFHQWSVLCCPDFPLACICTPATDRCTAFECKGSANRAKYKEKIDIFLLLFLWLHRFFSLPLQTITTTLLIIL